MAFYLGSPREPVWVDMPMGTTWLVDIHHENALAGYAQKRAQCYERLKRRLSADPNCQEPEFTASLGADKEAVCWLATLTVRAWREVYFHEDREPVPCEQDTIPGVLRAMPNGPATFWNAFIGALALWTVEKKGSGNSPAGTGTAAADSASTASTTASPAAGPAASAAPTSRAGRAARKGRRSGPRSAPAPAPSAAPNGTAG